MQNDIVKQPPQPQEESNDEPKQVKTITVQEVSEPDAPAQQEVQTQQTEESHDIPVVTQGGEAEPTTPEETAATPQPEPAPVPEPAPQEPPKPKSNKPVGIIVVATVLCLGLVGAAVYMGVKGKDDTKTASTQANSSQTSTSDQKTTAGASQVDSTISEADGLQDNVPDLEADVSDQALGLQ